MIPFKLNDAIGLVDTKRFITVNNKKVEVELRLCADHGCNNQFWATPKSKQSICCIACWEYVNQRAWYKCEQPKIRKPGEKQAPKDPKKKKDMRLRAIIDSAWKGHAAKTKSLSKSSSKPPPPPEEAITR